MARAILKFDEKELTIGEDATTFGRTTENTVSFPDNPNVSRNHAEIRFDGGEFVLTDLGSSNGTTVNGQPIEGESVLNDGDFITLGNSVIVEFMLEDDTPDNAEYAPQTAGSESIPEAVPVGETPKSKTGLILGATGAVCGLAVVFAVAATYVTFSGGGSSTCDATARITNPINGQVISQETDINVEVRNSACVGKVRVVLNGETVADLKSEPYTAKLDPKNYAALADGGLYALQVVLEDSEGNVIPPSQPQEMAMLQFETREIATPTKTPVVPGITPTPTVAGGKEVTLIDVQKMTAAVVGKFTGNFKYNLSNPEFLTEVRRQAAGYSKAEGYSARAAVYRDIINQSFVRDKGLPPSLPYLMAMSRSQFKLDKQGANEGLWQISNDFATANAYNVACQNKDLSETTQDCAAKATALYLEDLLVESFDGDIVLTVAAFGKSQQEANTWKATLPADRSDFWKVITDPAQREQVAKFFAAAIVAENPLKFGLKKERAISELYPAAAR
jgi:pSer/pThr/pTyr-binding forkhead associated (FHA) protein